MNFFFTNQQKKLGTYVSQILLLFFIINSSAHADNLFNPVLNPQINARSRGMGSTSISYVKGVDALFVNAAALARVEGYSLKLAEGHIGVSQNSSRLSDQNKTDSTPVAGSDLQKLYGQTFYAEGSGQSGMVFPRFGFGVYSNNVVTETFNNPVFPTFNVNFLSEYGYLIGASVPIGENISFGVTGRHVQRWSGQKDILVTDLIGTTDKKLIESSLNDKGVGEAMDLSFLANIPDQNLSLAIVWKDVGDTAFKTTSGNGPDRQQENLILGISKTSKAKFVDLTYAFEYDHIRQNDILAKKMHLGTEISMGIFDLRVGLNQGYFTYGAGVDLWLFNIDAAAYSEELGTSLGQNRSDRYQASISVNLDFDQAFKLKNQMGKKRRLIQRR